MAPKKAGERQAAGRKTDRAKGKEGIPNVQADDHSVAVGGLEIGGDQRGEINIAAGDIIKNIHTFHQRALTAAEEAAKAHQLERKQLAQGVGTLVQTLSSQAGQEVEHAGPYKGLLSYGLSEASIFYGRDQARRDLLHCVQQSALTVLHAESGAGKSSLLQAGLAAGLIADGHLALHLRPHYTNPVEFIKRMFVPGLSQAPALADASLREFLRQVCAILGARVKLYLLLDQFEEFFHAPEREQGRPFLQALADCLNDPSLHVRWVLALRAESLSDLAELEAFGITPFKNMYRLNRLRRNEAREAIAAPAGRYGIQFEPALIEHILDTLTIHEEVIPTHLQLVCSALVDDLPAEKTLTLAYYTDHEGGTEGILRDYLKRRLEDLPATEQSMAWKILRALITADHQRAVKTFDEIRQELKSSGENAVQIETILHRLVERRLLFTQPSTAESFELAHDYLVKEIQLDPQEQARKAAQELLDQETRSYQRHQTLLSAERLAVIEPHEDQLQVSDGAGQLILESRRAIRAGKRKRSTLLAAISLVAVLVAAAMTALWINAEKQSTIALARQLVTQAQALRPNGLSNGESNRIVATLLAIQSMRLNPSFEAQEILQPNSLPHVLFHKELDAAVNAVAFSPDGQYIVSGSADKTVRVWETASGMEITRFQHNGIVSSVAFPPLTGHKYVASAGCEEFVNGCIQGGIRIWDIAANQQIAFMEHDANVNAIAFSPNGRYLASASDDKTARLWDAQTGDEIARMEHGDAVVSLAFSPDGEHVVTASRDKFAHIWDVPRGSNVLRLSHTASVNAAVFSPDGNYVVSGGSDNAVRLWDIQARQQINYRLYTGAINTVAFSPDGQNVASGDWDYTVRLWGLQTGIERSLDMGGVVQFVSFSPDGRYLLAAGCGNGGEKGCDGGLVRVWATETGDEIAHLIRRDEIGAAAFGPAGRYIISGSVDNSLDLWEAIDRREKFRIPHQGDVSGTAFSPDGRFAVAISCGERLANRLCTTSSLHILDTANGREIADTELANYLTIVGFSADSKYVISTGCEEYTNGCVRGSIRLWELATGQQVSRLDQPGYAAPVGFDADARIVATRSCEDFDRTAYICKKGNTHVWQLADGKELVRIPHDGGLGAIALSRDGSYVAWSSCDEYNGSACMQTSLYVWNLVTGEEIARLRSKDNIYRVEFSPDGHYLAWYGAAHSVRLLDVSSRTELGSLRHDGMVYHAAFSPDSQYIVSGSADKTARVWEVSTGTEMTTMAHDDYVSVVAFSRTGEYVVSANGVADTFVWDPQTGVKLAYIRNTWASPLSLTFSTNNQAVLTMAGDVVRAWPLQPQALIEDACASLARNLTHAEWKQYIRDAIPYPARQEDAICPHWPLEVETTPTSATSP